MQESNEIPELNDPLLTYDEVVAKVNAEITARYGVVESQLQQEPLNPHAGINAFGGGTDGD